MGMLLRQHDYKGELTKLADVSFEPKAETVVEPKVEEVKQIEVAKNKGGRPRKNEA